MTDLLQGFLSGSAAWGVLLTLAAFALGALINKTTGKAIFNPLLLGSIFVIILLSVLNISYADYKVSAAPVNYLLLPATISLAIPLYEKWDLLKENAAAIIAGISVGIFWIKSAWPTWHSSSIVSCRSGWCTSLVVINDD